MPTDNPDLCHLPVQPVSVRWQAAKLKLRREGRPYQGLRVIDLDGERHVFKKGDKFVPTVLGNLDKQPADAFDVFTNPNDEVAVRETRRLPFYHLV